MEGDLSVVALVCRTSDRAVGAADAAAALAREIGARAHVDARIIGSAEPPRDGRWDDDLRDGRGCLLEAGGQVSDALRSGLIPVLTAADCSISMTTLREVARERPGTVVLWLDAHADFNSPASTESGYLGGMCLAAACGVWEPGLGSADPVAPESVVLAGVRDIDAGELPLIDTNGLVRADSTEEVLDQIADRPVFVHLDLDVLDPEVLPGAKFPAPDGLDSEDLMDLLEAVAEEAEQVVGLEITGLGATEHAPLVADVVGPLIGIV